MSADRSLAELEKSIEQVLARLQETEAENADLRQELAQLSESLEELERNNRELGGRISRYRRSRSAIRAKLNRIQSWLDLLGEPNPVAGNRFSEE